MTLITFALTSEYVVMASDRRLTVSAAGRVIDQSDRATKSTLLWGQMMMGYTGVAILDGVPMELWAAEKLAGVAPNDAPEVLADAMNRFYAKNRAYAGVPHHFIIAGFAYKPERSPSTWPMGAEVGNCAWITRAGRVVVSDSVSEFTARRKYVGNQGVIVGAVGSPYSAEGLKTLRRQVKFAARAKPTDPSAIFNYMVDFTRATAAKSNGAVGEVVTVSSILRSAIPSVITGWTFPLTADLSGGAKTQPFTHTFYPAGSAERTEWMPAIIYPDIQIAGMVASPGTQQVLPPDFPRL